jgi:hypothetical protein
MKIIPAAALCLIVSLIPFSTEAYGYYDYSRNMPTIRYQSGFYNARYNMITYKYYAPEPWYPDWQIVSRPNYSFSYVPSYNGYAYNQGGVMVIR